MAQLLAIRRQTYSQSEGTDIYMLQLQSTAAGLHNSFSNIDCIEKMEVASGFQKSSHWLQCSELSEHVPDGSVGQCSTAWQVASI